MRIVVNLVAPARSAILFEGLAFRKARALEVWAHVEFKLETLFHMRSYLAKRSTTYPRDDVRTLRLGLADASKNTFPPLPLEALMCFVKKMQIRQRVFRGNKLYDAIVAPIVFNL